MVTRWQHAVNRGRSLLRTRLLCHARDVIYLVHADGAMPNLALMRLATKFRSQGEDVRLLRIGDRLTLFDPVPRHGHVFGSSLFSFSKKRREKIEREWGKVTWGGTGVRVESSLSEIDPSVDWESVAPDYSLYPNFDASMGFLTRGCRLRCGFCVVPAKEGKPFAVSTVHDVWRKDPHPRHLHLLDNDAFAPQLREHWRKAVEDIRTGGFRVCFSQGINLRLVDEESAAAIASLPYYASDFIHRGLYTAWDNLGDESIFRRGIDMLGRAGVPAHHLTVYMLVGYDPKETWETIFYRFGELVALGCDPYPMVFDRVARPDLCAFQRWALRHLYRTVPFPEYAADGTKDKRLSSAARALATEAWARIADGWRPASRGLAVVSR